MTERPMLRDVVRTRRHRASRGTYQQLSFVFPSVRWTTIAKVALGLAFYVLTFSNDPRFAQQTQLAGVALLVAASLLTIPGRPAANFGPSVFETVLAIAIMVSAILGPLNGVVFSVYYNVIMFAVLFAASTLVRRLSLQEVLHVAASAHAATCATVLLVYWQLLPVILSSASGARWTLRFAPFNLHPNLVGFVYGLGAIVATYAAIKSKSTARWVYSLTALTSVVFVFAASARAGLLAAVVSAAVILIGNFRNLPRLYRRVVVLLGVGAALVGAAFWGVIFEYLSVILELASPTRGLGSGATGRTEMWRQGLDFIVRSPQQIVVGSGLRSAYPEIIGFSTESSYITILIESGVIIGLFMIASILFAPIALSLSASMKRVGRVEVVFVLWLILFAASQSIFNRYLLAIGNPGSLLLLLCYSFAWLGVFTGKRESPSRT